MAFTVNAFNHKEWEKNSLADYGDFAECVEYVNQRPDGFEQYCGEWFYIPDENLPPMKDVDYGTEKPNERVIYFGSFGNDNSPGASMYTNAEIFDMSSPEDAAEFEERKAKWEAAEEYLEIEGDEPEDEDDSDDEEDE